MEKVQRAHQAAIPEVLSFHVFFLFPHPQVPSTVLAAQLGQWSSHRWCLMILKMVAQLWTFTWRHKNNRFERNWTAPLKQLLANPFGGEGFSRILCSNEIYCQISIYFLGYRYPIIPEQSVEKDYPHWISLTPLSKIN